MKFIIFLMFSVNAFSQTCIVVKDGKEQSFDGKSVDGLTIEKKSLNNLNKVFPALSVQEKVFSGAVQTCLNCDNNYVKCK